MGLVGKWFYLCRDDDFIFPYLDRGSACTADLININLKVGTNTDKVIKMITITNLVYAIYKHILFTKLYRYVFVWHVMIQVDSYHQMQ